MSIESKVVQLGTKITEYFDTVSDILGSKLAWVLRSEDAGKLEDATPASMKGEVDTVLDEHIGDKNNPHRITPFSIGGYSNEEFEDMMNRRVTAGIIPISRFGSLDGAEIPRTTGGWTLTFPVPLPVIINGVFRTLPTTAFDLEQVSSQPANKTFFIYCHIDGGSANYSCQVSFIPETQTSIYIGTVTTDDNGINSSSIEPVTLFAGHRLSATPSGSAIPITTGLPSQEGSLHSGWL